MVPLPVHGQDPGVLQLQDKQPNEYNNPGESTLTYPGLFDFK